MQTIEDRHNTPIDFRIEAAKLDGYEANVLKHLAEMANDLYRLDSELSAKVGHEVEEKQRQRLNEVARKTRGYRRIEPFRGRAPSLNWLVYFAEVVRSDEDREIAMDMLDRELVTKAYYLLVALISMRKDRSMDQVDRGCAFITISGSLWEM